ncbi:MAG: NAD(P)-dependent alcohol dehydrogenase, partial [Polyangiales bacterium]
MSALPQYGKHLHPSATMRAVLIDRYGGPEVLRLATVPRPVPARGQVLVRTRFIGVNPKDVIVRKGKFQIATGKKFPLIVGHDISGEVVEVGLGADLVKGDQVYGMINDFAGRAYAEYAAVDCQQLAKAPASIELAVAAAVPLAAQTALQALRDDAQLKAGQTVLINGASGGVGVFAVQIAKILGAHVTAVCSHRNVELVTELGADRVIDYTKIELVDL